MAARLPRNGPEEVEVWFQSLEQIRFSVLFLALVCWLCVSVTLLSLSLSGEGGGRGGRGGEG